MEEAPENGKESSHIAHANGIGIDDFVFTLNMAFIAETCR
jgi:hypothetical protein